MSRTFLDREGLLILILAVAVMALLAAGAFVLWKSPDAPPVVTHDTKPPPVDGERTSPPPFVSDTTLEFEYPGQDGRTVLELLNEQHTVRLDSELLLFGSIVLAIDTFAAAPDQYWIYYRDSLRGDRSPEVCTTFAGETIRWVLTRRLKP